MIELPTDRGAWTMARCSVADTLDIVGNRIALLLVREALLGTTRFDDFAQRVGVSEPAAAKRLSELVDHGILERVPYREPGQRERSEYRLTPRGRDLIVIIGALRDWGDTWLAGEAGPPLRVEHSTCGTAVHAELRCERGHRVKPGQTRLQGLDGIRLNDPLEPSDSPRP